MVLLIGTALVFLGTKAYATPFSDVLDNSRYAEAFTYLSQRNIVHGHNDGTAKPNAHLSRVEALTTILRSREKYAPQVVWFTDNLPNIALFSDTDQSAWYAPYIEVGFLEGVVTGHGDGTFNPSQSLTIEQALVMIQRAYKKSNEEVPYATSDRLINYKDQWFTSALSTANSRNLIMAGQSLKPGSIITRGQFFDILYRLHSIEKQRIYAFDGPEPEVAITSLPSLPSLPSVPLSITPIPFGTSDPFVLNLEPPRTSFEPVEQAPIMHEYASSKEFAITIPSLDLYDVAIIHPNDPFSSEGILAPLKDGLGHLFSYPGTIGKMMVYGHSSSYPWDLSDYTKIFRQVNKLESGERVYITHKGKLHVYEVSRKQVIDAADVSPFDDDGTSELILYTCWPPDSIKQRYLVHAMPVETVAIK
jgi:LPXTG-site transpeptidase (sortase) family protein